MEALSWRWILLVNAPVALGVALVAWRVIPALGRRERSFDLAGAITVTAGLVLVTYGVVASHRHGWTSVATVAPLLVGLDLLALFALIEAYVARAPLVPPRMLRSRALVGANVAAMCLGGSAISMWFFLSLYVQQVLGYTPLRAGLTFLPMSLTILACTQAAGRLAARVGSGRVLAVGLTLLGTGLLLFARRRGVGVLAPSLLCAAGIGCSFVSATITATTGVRREDSGLASGLVNTSFQVGGSVGLAAAGDDRRRRRLPGCLRGRQRHRARRRHGGAPPDLARPCSWRLSSGAAGPSMERARPHARAPSARRTPGSPLWRRDRAGPHASATSQIALEAAFFRHGADMLAFDTIVGGGPERGRPPFPAV